MKLQKLREEKLLSLESLAEKAIEERRNKPYQITGNNLAKAFEVRPDQIEEVSAAVLGAWESRDGYLGPQ